MAKLLTVEHLLAVAVIAAVIATLVAGARLRPGPWMVVACRILAVIILANEAAWWVWLGAHGTWSASYALPLQLCDVAAVVSAAALWWRQQLLVELTYFWGIAGTANGLITPDITDHFPSFVFMQYFIAHGAIVAAALLLVIGLRLAPRRGAVMRVFGLTFGLLVLDAGINLVTGGNYLYLRHTPGAHSLLDVLGRWPWYIAGAAGLALVLFAILDLPFAISRRRRKLERAMGIEPT
ncbi:MAG TPA: TIGR02206 family membrane protein [Candidatus Dormibacteraeota bacterium]|nr:TIGR02206 family membrane protein [Candidatus Dormibacteraeota bacterium]